MILQCDLYVISSQIGWHSVQVGLHPGNETPLGDSDRKKLNEKELIRSNTRRENAKIGEIGKV